MALKLVLVGPKGTVFQDGQAKTVLLDHLVEFIKRMAAKGVCVALWSRHPTNITTGGSSPEPVETYLSRRSGVNVTFYRAASGMLLDRARGGSVDPILKDASVERHESILVGNEDTDLRAGVNNKLLLIRPEWYPSELGYGFSVESFSELIQFCELFALRKHPIYWSIDQKNLHVRAMGPFSTIIPDFTAFGEDAKSASKRGGGEPRFWFLMVISTLYFSGMMHEADFICRFPGHNPTMPTPASKALDAFLIILGKCFSKPYLPNLIVRHVAAVKSQNLRAAERTFRNQLNTLHLNSFPLKYDKPWGKSPVSLRSKRVLVVDDICTSGRSLDVARAYIEAAGGTATLFSWLKTISAAYSHMTAAPKLLPFATNTIRAEPPYSAFLYNSHIVDPGAPAEIDALLAAYKAWKWP